MSVYVIALPFCLVLLEYFSKRRQYPSIYEDRVQPTALYDLAALAR